MFILRFLAEAWLENTAVMAGWGGMEKIHRIRQICEGAASNWLQTE